MIRHLLLILTLVPTILFSQFTVTSTTESWDKEKKNGNLLKTLIKNLKKQLSLLLFMEQ